MALQTRISLALLVVFSLALDACGARSALKDPRPDGAVVSDVPVVPDIPVIPDVPVVPDIPVIPDVPVIVDRVTPPDIVPPRDIPVIPDVPVTVTAVCPSSQRAVETQTVSLAGRGSQSAGGAVFFAWTIDTAPAGVAMPALNLTTPASAATGLRLAAAGTWRARLTVRDALGHSDSCVTTIEADAAIDLVCPNDQSHYQSDTASLTGRATSRLGRALRYGWTLTRRPATSMAAVTPAAGSLSTQFVCDALGDYTVQLTATDDGGLTRSCTANIHVDPDVLATCPADIVSVPFSTVSLAGMGTSRLGLPLTYRWTTESAPPTSTGALTTPMARVSGFTFDVAGNFVWRFTVSNSRGNSASCTTRAFSRSDEAVRVELVWNVDRSCRSCDATTGGGIDIDLHLADLSRSMGHWAGSAPDNSDCYYGNCRCDRSVGMLCPDGVLTWAPDGPVNNPQLDVDHISDLPGPENINVTQAAAGTRFAVGVHYFNGPEPTPVVVRVYCGGVVVFESERVTLSGSTGSAGGNPLWHVGDITVGADGRACVFSRCGRAGALTDCIRPHDSW